MTAEPPRSSGTPSPRSTLLRWLPLLILPLPFWLWALWVTHPEGLLPALLAAGLGLVSGILFLAALAGRDRRVAELHARAEEARARAERAHIETATLADQHLPRLIHHLSQGDSAQTALHRIDLPQSPGSAAVLRVVADEISTAERRRSAAMAACATAAGRVQALTTTMLADLRRMQERHGDGAGGAEDVLGDLMHLDHITAQTGRVADSIAVLTGARSGRRWSRSIPVESILRGAMGRIGAYQRVRTHGVPQQTVAGFAAEGVIHALAEILDNAAKFSPPTAEVHVHVEEVQAGLTIMVEDGGLVMGEEALGRARRAVEGGLDIAAISGTRLGLPVVGRLARRYGLTVSFRSSSRGGTAVVMLLPQNLIKPMPAEPSSSVAAVKAASAPEAAPVQRPVEPNRSDTVPTSAEPISTESVASTSDEPEPRLDNGLPQRRRGRALAAVERTRPTTATDSAPATPVRGFGAFRSAVRGQGRPTDSSKDT
ncbi:ATP-binding protein [Nocardiopsis alkaliphila]|uniref:ATP-binding protein n=1 Tax=Nocardiopsis alkaliphila TaxID=225762 RepID=UPI0003485900|nr:ATP-binding protein [Nocardiopsis alkaliphila]